MALVMSRPSVVPRYAVTVGSLSGGTVIGETPEERGKLHLEFYTLTPCRAVNKTKLIGRNCLIFRYARSFDFAQDDKEELIFVPVCLFVNRTKLFFNTTYNTNTTKQKTRALRVFLVRFAR